MKVTLFILLTIFATKILAVDIPLLDLSAEIDKKKPEQIEPKEPVIDAPALTVVTKPKPVPVKQIKKTPWSYSGKGRPELWGKLSKAYSLCATGKNQSPISLNENTAVATTGLAGFDVFYRDAALRIQNTGKTIKIIYPLGSFIKINDSRYELMHFNFHTPSKHQLNGFNFPMEMHLVHKNAKGNVVVIAIIFQEGKTNTALQDIVRKLPNIANRQGKPQLYSKVKINPSKFLPLNKKFYKYNGSLTTPPCSEGVYWMVFQHPIEASALQIQQIHKIMGNNNRPVQPQNARTVLKSWSEQPANQFLYEF